MEQTNNLTLEQRVDQLFAEWDKPDCPGAALAVVKDGEVIYKRGYGRAHMEYDIPITTSTVFHVASVSKQFTAMAIALLAHEGKLCLDAEVQTYIPEVPRFEHPITVRQLVHHTSGLRDQWELLMLAGWRLDDVITFEHIMKLVARQQELNFAPGSEYLYSNTGYTLMAEIVARVSGMSFRQFADKHIFKPLGMNHTHFHTDHDEIVWNRAYSYSPRMEGGYRTSVLSYANVGATSLFTTAEDLTKWLMNFETQVVGSPEVMETMHKRFVLNDGKEIDYAFGLSYTKHKGLQAIGHSGADAGFRSYCGRFPEHGLGIVVLSNLGNFNPQRLAMQVAELYLADALVMEDTATEEASVDQPHLKLEELAGSYLVSFLGEMVEISVEDEALMVKMPQSPATKLVAQEDGAFLHPVLNAKLSFRRNDEGVVTHLVVPMYGHQIMAKKITASSLSAEELAAFVGNYYSEELDTTYRFIVKDGELTITQQRHPDHVLLFTGGDTFEGKKRGPGQLSFLRGADNSVTGFRLTGGRVRNLLFTRVS